MREAGRSSLSGQTGILVGSGFGKHPADAGKSVNVVVYRTPDQWVLCLSEVSGCGDREGQRAALGTAVPGRLFAAYAARGIEATVAYSRVREMVQKGVPPDVEFQWLAEAQLQAEK